MGIYLNPPLKAKEGRSLEGLRYQDLFTQLKSGEILIGLYNNLRWNLALHLFSEAEYNEFHSQYNNGYMVSEEFYAVPKEWIE